MRKNYLFTAVMCTVVLASCSQDERLDFIKNGKTTFAGALETADSRTSLDGTKVVWNNEDQVSIFEKDNANSLYKVSTITDGVASFEFVSYTEPATWVDLDANYAVYPYSEGNSIAADGTISAMVPAAYTFTDRASSIENALMAAKSENTELNFINAQGIIRLRLNAKKPTKYGNIQSIKLTSKANNLTGTATISFENTTTPSAVITGTDAGKELTINLTDELKVALPSSTTGTFTEFYVPVVPTNFATGDLTLTVVGDKDTYVYEINAPINVGRKVIKGITHTLDRGGYTGEIDGETTEAWDGETLTEVTPNNGVYTITKASELAWMSARALTENNGIDETVTIDLKKDIDMGGFEFSSIIAQRGDGLVFKGNNHTISNVKIVSGANDNTTGSAAMFYCYPSSTLEVSDVILKDITVTADEEDTGYAAAVVGYCEGTAKLNNVDVVNATVIGVKSSGMLVGHLSGSLEATNCDLTGTVKLNTYSKEANGHYAGKYIGTVAGTASLIDCTVTATVSGSLNSSNVGDVYGRMVSGSLKVNGATYVNSSTALKEAVAAGATNIYLQDGEYDVEGCGGKTLTINGSKNAVLKIVNGGEAGLDPGFDGSTVTFNGVTFNSSENDGANKGYTRMTGIYNSCTFIGEYCTSNYTHKFNECVFAEDRGGYVWTWGATEVTFDTCKFKGGTKTILAHEGNENGTTINIKDCSFEATVAEKTGAGDLTAVVEIDPHPDTKKFTVNFTGNNTKTDIYAGWVRVKDGTTGHTITGIE